MKNTELFYLIFKQTRMGRFLLSFAVFFLAACLVMYWTDPSITSYADALWFGFMVCTTIGFGDYTVVHPVARLTAAFLGGYGIILSVRENEAGQKRVLWTAALEAGASRLSG